jgi:hypothetical protein
MALTATLPASTCCAVALADERSPMAAFWKSCAGGSATIELGGGKTTSFEWGPRSLFSPPLNAPYRLFNASGREGARIAVASNLGFMMNVYRNIPFLFDNKTPFPGRVGREAYYTGEGDFLPLAPGKHMWETNFIPDLGSFELPEWEARGAGSRNLKIILADSAMHAHTSEMPVGTYKKGHRHGPGAHVFAINGSGYTLMWKEGDEEFERHEWQHGFVFAPPDGMFHQHFNTGTTPARYLAFKHEGVAIRNTQGVPKAWISRRVGGDQIVPQMAGGLSLRAAQRLHADDEAGL